MRQVIQEKMVALGRLEFLNTDGPARAPRLVELHTQPLTIT
jgi:hypothetical protein